MFREINSFLEYLNTDDDGKIIRNRIVIIILIIVITIFFNRFVLSPFVSDDLRVSLSQSKLLFVNGKSPYDLEILNYIKGIAEDEGWALNAKLEFGYPLFQLLIYLPFAVIPNYLWASAFFLTINQVCIVLITHMLFQVLEWKPKIVERISVYLLSAAVFFIQVNMFSGNTSIIQLTLIVAVLYYEEDRKPILSGIFLGLSFIDPISMLFTIIVLLSIFITKKEYSIIFWFLITTGLLSVFVTIYDGNWIIGWLKNMVLAPSRFPFTTYVDGIQTKYGVQVNKLFVIIPIILTSWLILEVFRTPKETAGEKIWLLCISGLINYYVMVQPEQYAAVLFFPSLILLISVWWKKINNIGKIMFYLLLTAMSVGVILLPINTSIITSTQVAENIYLSITIFILTNLYWARSWIVRPL
jgi:hypothetical protein